jgi:hypothetical protein
MGTQKQELMDKMEKIKAEQDCLMIMLHRIDETEIRFEIGKTDDKGHSRVIFSSKSIKRAMSEYTQSGYTEKDGYLIDVWEGDQPVADINTDSMGEKKSKNQEREWLISLIEKNTYMFISDSNSGHVADTILDKFRKDRP